MVTERRRATAGVAEQRGGPRALDLAAAVSWRLLVCAGAVAVAAIVLARLRLVVLPICRRAPARDRACTARRAAAPTTRSRRGRRPIVVAGAVAAIAGAIAVVVLPVWRELDELDVDVRGGLERIADWLGLFEQQVDATIERTVAELREHSESIAGGLVGGGVLALELVAGSLLALVLLFFVLKDGERIWRAAVGVFPAQRRAEVDATGTPQREGHLLQPLIVGRSVRLHPVAVLLAVAIGGIVWEIPGAFVAVPLTLTLVATADALRASPATLRERADGRHR